ncbi:hypothetical protein CRUP_013286 [Coryphaenoides rupestris]|nr:hypothetical protein CRUP_013286 [Coryphaenoides rupestris]
MVLVTPPPPPPPPPPLPQGQVLSQAMNGSAGQPPRPLSPPAYPPPPASLNTMGLHRQSRSSEGSECYTRETVVSGLSGGGGSAGGYSTLPIARFSEEERKVSLIKAPHYEGIGPVDESGIPIAIRTVGGTYMHCLSGVGSGVVGVVVPTSTPLVVVGREVGGGRVDGWTGPRTAYKTMFKQIHMVHKAEAYNLSSDHTLAHPPPKTHTYRPLARAPEGPATASGRRSPTTYRKVDTRKYRAEPKSIFEYEPGKSSILAQERPMWTRVCREAWRLLCVHAAAYSVTIFSALSSTTTTTTTPTTTTTTTLL